MTAYDDMIDQELADTLEANRIRRGEPRLNNPRQNKRILQLTNELRAERKLREAAEKNASQFHALLIQERIRHIPPKRVLSDA